MTVDYRELLKTYMKDVIADDPVVGARNAQHWSVLEKGTPEREALIEILKEIDPGLLDDDE